MNSCRCFKPFCPAQCELLLLVIADSWSKTKWNGREGRIRAKSDNAWWINALFVPLVTHLVFDSWQKTKITELQNCKPITGSAYVVFVPTYLGLLSDKEIANRVQKLSRPVNYARHCSRPIVNMNKLLQYCQPEAASLLPLRIGWHRRSILMHKFVFVLSCSR